MSCSSNAWLHLKGTKSDMLDKRKLGNVNHLLKPVQYDEQ